VCGPSSCHLVDQRNPGKLNPNNSQREFTLLRSNDKKSFSNLETVQL